jgi:hypothetical protein
MIASALAIAAHSGARVGTGIAGAEGRQFARPFRLIGVPLNLHLALTPLISLLAGILILVVPKLLNFIVAIYLIVIGLVGLLGAGTLHLS